MTVAGVPTWALVPFALPLGLAVGSFLNVVISRLPEGLSLSTPRSRCPQCLTPIGPRDNVPVFSWLALRGRCRSCRLPIPVAYPVVEAATGFGFALGALRFGLGWELAAYVSALCALVVAGGISAGGRPVPVVVPAAGLGGSAAALVAALATGSVWPGGAPAAIGAALAATAFVAIGSARAEDGFLGRTALILLVALVAVLLGWQSWWQPAAGFAIALVAATLGRLPVAVGLAAGGAVAALLPF